MTTDMAQRLHVLGPTGATAESVVLRLRLIGQMEAWTLTSESVLPAGRKTRALLAVIALTAPRSALRGKLAELLWSRRPEEQARASLRQEIHRLLEALSMTGGDVLHITRDHLALRPGAVWVDVHEVLRATTTQPASLSLLDGDLLEDLDGVDPAFDAWLTTERERLRDRARNLAEELLHDQQDPELAIPAAQRLLAIDRSHEGAWRALMRAHAARGERGMAIQAYDRCHAVLADLLDAAPSIETQKLLSEIRGPASRPAVKRLAAQGLEEPQTPEFEPPRDVAPTPRIEVAVPRSGVRIGILPLQFAGADAEDGYLATGIADEITTALARFRSLSVVSSNAMAHFAETSRDEAAIRRLYEIDLLLDGSVQRGRDRVRVTARLMDLRAGNQIVWTQRFEHQSDEVLALQDSIGSAVVAQLESEILLIEARRATGQSLAGASAHDLVLRAIPLIIRLEKSPFFTAGEYLKRAIALAPDDAFAHAWLGYWHFFLIAQGWAEDRAAATALAADHAERAVALDPQDARALSIAAHIRAYLGRRLREAATMYDRALALNPNLAMAWALSAVTQAYLGDLEEAERRNRRYKTLSPLDPQAFMFDTVFVLIALLKRDVETAVAVGQATIQMNPGFSGALKPYLAALGHAQQMREAAVVRARLFAMEPDYSIARFLATTPMERPADREFFVEGLRLAGVPESGFRPRG